MKLKRAMAALGIYYGIYLILTSLFEPFTWFNSDSGKLTSFGWKGHAVMLAAPVLIMLVPTTVSSVRNHFLKKYLGVIAVSSGEHRDDAFRALWRRSRKRIVFVGVGMTKIALYHLRDMGELVQRVPIDLLMLDPTLLEENPELAKRFDEFFGIVDCDKKLRSSFETIRTFCEDWNRHSEHRFKFRLRLYKTIPTVSMVLIDPDDDDSELMIEFFLYQSGAYRPRLHVQRISDPNGLFYRIKAEYERLWNSAVQVL
jgi:hypothetical protein